MPAREGATARGATALWTALWPFGQDAPNGRSWALTCLLIVLPTTAIFHHVVFYSTQCILNPFGSDYDLSTIGRLLARDPSLPWAIAACGALWMFGSKREWVRQAIAPLFFAFLPLTVYLWDVPFSGRIICARLHDAQPILGDFHLRTLHLYAGCAVVYLATVGYLFARVRFASTAWGLPSGIEVRANSESAGGLPSLGA